MSAFIDVRCRCGKRFGWCGAMSDRPPCPRCGFRPGPDEDAALAAELEKAEAEILKARRAALGPD